DCTEPDFLSNEVSEARHFVGVDFPLGTFPIEVDVVQLVGSGFLPGEAECVLEQLRRVEKLERCCLAESDCERLTIGTFLQRPQLFAWREIFRIQPSLS